MTSIGRVIKTSQTLLFTVVDFSAEGVELTKEEAEAYMAEMEDVELDSDALKQVAGGLCYSVGLGADQRCNRGGGIAGA